MSQNAALSADVKASIQKNLPAMVAEEMAAFIKQAEAQATELVNVKRMLGEATERCQTLSTENGVLKAAESAVKARETAVAARETAVTGVEHTLEIAKLRVELSNDKVLFVSDVHNKIFGNRVVRESNLENIPFQAFGQGYNAATGQPYSFPTGMSTVPAHTNMAREEG